jgi:hypothetical protein
MRSKTSLASSWLFLGTVCVLALLHLSSAFPAAAQQGQDAVYNLHGTPTNSSAFIDASQFIGNVSNADPCKVLNYVLANVVQPTYPNGAVVDARALASSSALSMTCGNGWTPWYNQNSSTYTAVPSTILLPPGTIQIQATWILPSNTRLIGEGEGVPTPNTTPPFAAGTTIQVASGNLLSTMIQFGSSSATVCPSGVCNGISVERLTLDGQALSVDGIINQFSQNNTYVDHVTLYQILGTGLSISSINGSSASNSGPYTNITFDTGGHSGTASTVCAQILNVNSNLTGTKGIRGLRCKSENQDAPAAVLLDASSNSIEDVNIVGFYDGILVGSQASAQSNVLHNIVGDTAAGNVAPVNVVHISGNKPVTDLSIMGVTNVVAPANGQNSIKDDVTSTTLGDTNVAIYALAGCGKTTVRLRTLSRLRDFSD